MNTVIGTSCNQEHSLLIAVLSDGFRSKFSEFFVLQEL